MSKAGVLSVMRQSREVKASGTSTMTTRPVRCEASCASAATWGWATSRTTLNGSKPQRTTWTVIDMAKLGDLVTVEWLDAHAETGWGEISNIEIKPQVV